LEGNENGGVAQDRQGGSFSSWMVGFSIAFNSSCSDLDQIANIRIQSKNLQDIIVKLPI